MLVGCQNLEDRAKEVLGMSCEGGVDVEEVKRAFRVMVKKTHPDLNGNSQMDQYFMLIVQAKDYLLGFLDSNFLENDVLVECFLGEPIDKLKESYQLWIGSRGFYDFLGVN